MKPPNYEAGAEFLIENVEIYWGLFLPSELM